MKLTVYEYRWPIESQEEMPLVATRQTDERGNFDFGSLKSGHYTLVVEDKRWGGASWFDVEIAKPPKETVSVLVDISPNFPDCKGGHEFVINTK